MNRTGPGNPSRGGTVCQGQLRYADDRRVWRRAVDGAICMIAGGDARNFSARTNAAFRTLDPLRQHQSPRMGVASTQS